MISVVIPVYNEAAEIERCLEAFVRQTYRGPFELILVDNGSTDGSPELIRAFARAHPDLELRLIYEEVRGAAAASQRGFEAANYPLIARTDADTVVDARWLEAIAERFRDGCVAAVCGHVGFHDPTPLQRWLLLEGLIELHQRLHILIKRPHFWGFNFAVRREVFRRTSGFNTRLRLAEDLDLALRVQRVLRPGERIVYAPEVKVYSSSRRYGLNREWLRYTIQGYRAYFQLAWLGRTPPWMCFDDRPQQDRLHPL
jgi:glycosyltransferase involved in cell wall biosynthesis